LVFKLAQFAHLLALAFFLAMAEARNDFVGDEPEQILLVCISAAPYRVEELVVVLQRDGDALPPSACKVVLVGQRKRLRPVRFRVRPGVFGARVGNDPRQALSL
jgi:hypothetical protein